VAETNGGFSARAQHLDKQNGNFYFVAISMTICVSEAKQSYQILPRVFREDHCRVHTSPLDLSYDPKSDIRLKAPQRSACAGLNVLQSIQG
jgi:hypothetical protein